MLAIFLVLAQLGTSSHIVVDADQIMGHVSPDMFGSCIEDVNHEIYGGLYGQRIFGESFEEPGPVRGPAGWRALGGNWTSNGHSIRTPGGAGPMLLLDHHGFGDGVVQARLAAGNGADSSAGLLVRVSNVTKGIDNFDGYEIALRAKQGSIALGRHCHDYRFLREATAPVHPGEFHRLKVVLRGPRIQVYLDDELVPRIDYTDADHRLITGTIALRPWQTAAEYADLQVNGRTVDLGLSQSGVSEMWDPIGRAKFALEGGAVNGLRCQRITLSEAGSLAGVANSGLNRWGISVKSGEPMDGHLSLHGTVAEALIALQSEDGSRTYASTRLPVTSKWKRLSFRLLPRITYPKARLAVMIRHKGTLWLDQVVLVGGDKFQGLPVRGDIARALVHEHLTFLRYGGTMVNVPGYRWKNMIGDPDRRPPYVGNWYPYSSNGFGIFDFLRFCEKAHFGAAFAINAEETPQDAADLADYLTAPTRNRWGARRAADGHPEPYHPAYIEIGNEEAISGDSHFGLLHYAERFRLLERAIHGRNPTLNLVCAAWWLPNSPDMKAVFNAVDGKAAAWDIHVWSDDADAGKAVDRDLSQIERMFRGWNAQTRLKVVVFEENGNRHDVQRALGHATTLNATRRHGDFVLADCAANCLQPWLQNDNGWDQGQVFFKPNDVWDMPPSDAQRILADDYLPLRVASRADGGLDTFACRSVDGQSLALTLVNVSGHAVHALLSMGSFSARSGRIRTLSGHPETTNPSKGPKQTTYREALLPVGSGEISVDLPAYSLSSVRIGTSQH